jgi:uncharacterized protein YegP (UPF0339 family)
MSKSKPKNKPGIHLFKSKEYTGSIKSDKGNRNLYEVRWFWHLVASNGRIIARSSETYTRKGNAVKSIYSAARVFWEGPPDELIPYYDHSLPGEPVRYC